VPRSGTTLLYRLLGQHRDLGWFSQDTNRKFYTKDYLEFVYLRRRILGLRKISYPQDAFGEGSFLTTTSPVELGDFWQETFKGGWNAQVTEKGISTLKKIITETLVEQKRKRFLAKELQLSIKIPIINKIFSDSKFIHIIRDGRAVVNSLLRRAKENSSGYFGIPLKNSLRNISKSQMEKHSLQYIEVVDEIRRVSKSLLKNQYMEIRYEDLVDSPDPWMEKITSFCELPPFNYLYEKNREIFHKEGKNDDGWEFSRMANIKNRNLSHENDSEIEKYILPKLQELGYK